MHVCTAAAPTSSVSVLLLLPAAVLSNPSLLLSGPFPLSVDAFIAHGSHLLLVFSLSYRIAANHVFFNPPPQTRPTPSASSGLAWWDLSHYKTGGLSREALRGSRTFTHQFDVSPPHLLDESPGSAPAPGFGSGERIRVQTFKDVRKRRWKNAKTRVFVHPLRFWRSVQRQQYSVAIERLTLRQ